MSSNNQANNRNAGRKRSAGSSNTGPYRSVVDFDTEDELRKALMAADMCTTSCTPMLAEIQEGRPVQKVARTGEKQSEVAAALDWVLPSYDPDTTEPQSMKEELTRLQVLKSYLILDAEREEAFERITALASRIFDVPIALVSLVDLGRQWFMSNHGLGDARETPRKYAFCAHAILNKSKMLVVPDARLDFRFRENPLVTGPPHIRFYAGAALESPEGYKLGTFCIIDGNPRPNGLTAEQQETLKDLANMTVKVMIDRRYQKRESPAELIAYTAHELMTPLTGMQLSLSLLKEDEVVKKALGEHQMELLNTAASCSDLMIRICQASIDSLRQSGTASADLAPNIFKATPTINNANAVSVTKMDELVKSLHMIMDPIKKKVPCFITLADNVPPIVLGDDLKLFRSALNLLTNAVSCTSTGMVRFTIRSDLHTHQLLFECEDTGEDIPVEEYQYLFQPSRSDDGNVRLGLSSVATLITSLNGEYGFRPRGVAEDGSILFDSKGRRCSGSIFWFSIPLYVPDTLEAPGVTNVPTISVIRQPGTNYCTVRTAPMQMQMPAVGSILCRPNSCDDMIAQFAIAQDRKMPAMENIAPMMAADDADGAQNPGARIKRALVIDDSIVVRKSLARALSKLGFEVGQAVDGVEGLRELKAAMWDLVLLDYLMPNLDGLDCVKQYRNWESQNRPRFHQLIIGISAHASINDTQGIEAGMDDFRPKPISIKTLEELQASEAAISCSRRLDELEDIASQANLVDSDFADDFDALALPVDSVDSAVGGAPADTHVAEQVCLVATDTPTLQSNQVLHELEASGWKVVVVHDGDDALRLLQMRNWGAVMIDDDLPVVSGAECMRIFREWEQQHRVNGQKNVFLVCEGDVPSPFDKNSLIQPPNGFNGVLRKPVPWIDLQFLLAKSSNDSMNIVLRKR